MMMMIRVGSPIFGCLSSSKSSSSSSSINYNNYNPSLLSSKSFISVPSKITINNHHHSSSMVSAASSNGSSSSSSSLDEVGRDSFLRTVLSSIEQVYLNRNPTANAILVLVRSSTSTSANDYDNVNQICYDHLAFRTFGVNGHGIESMSKLFLDYGYTQREELTFPKKKLKALWFSPPPPNGNSNGGTGSGIYGPLPRVFISELLVDQMSLEAQEIIHKYIGLSGAGHKHSALSSALGCLTWPKPSHSEFLQLARESEYAAWTLVNGYTLNHVTISTHRLKSPLNNIDNLNHFIEDNGFKLNSEGGVLKGGYFLYLWFLFSLSTLILNSISNVVWYVAVSPDGLLLQSSTVADSILFEFSDGVKDSVPCSYIEFAQRLVLPQYKHLPEDKIEEVHRRDGFEVGNADKIFESTSKEQLTRKA